VPKKRGEVERRRGVPSVRKKANGVRRGKFGYSAPATLGRALRSVYDDTLRERRSRKDFPQILIGQTQLKTAPLNRAFR